MSVSAFAPELLLDGIRGRGLCFALLSRTPRDALSRLERLEPTEAAAVLAEATARTDLEAIAAAEDPVGLLPPLLGSVSTARYWQEPWDHDLLLAPPQVARALAPVAEAVAHSPAASGWVSQIARKNQFQVIVEDPHHPEQSPPRFRPGALAEWRDGAVADELRAQRDRPADPAAAWSGRWWSTPAPAGLVSSSRALGGNGPVGLGIQEDDWGWTAALAEPLGVAASARIVEIDGPEAWAELVRRHPFDVSASRRQDWFRATGRAGRWVIPDYAALAADYDGVHLTVLGYLTAAQRAIEVDPDTATVLAGWAPDTTWWLNDVVVPAGPAVRWTRERDAETWHLWRPDLAPD